MGFVLARFVSTYFTVILLGIQMFFVIAGCHCIRLQRVKNMKHFVNGSPMSGNSLEVQVSPGRRKLIICTKYVVRRHIKPKIIYESQLLEKS